MLPIFLLPSLLSERNQLIQVLLIMPSVKNYVTSVNIDFWIVTIYQYYTTLKRANCQVYVLIGNIEGVVSGWRDDGLGYAGNLDGIGWNVWPD